MQKEKYFRFWLDGLTNKPICDAIDFAIGGMKSHKENIIKKGFANAKIKELRIFKDEDGKLIFEMMIAQ